MNIVFFGGGDFAVTILQRLITAHSLSLVVTPPPRPAGRGLIANHSPVACIAQAHHLPLCHQVEAAALSVMPADVLVVCDYGMLLPAELLSAAKGGALNVHPSLLPRWRGSAPIERALLAGDSITGVTIMRMNERLDAGALLAQSTHPILSGMTGGQLQAELADAGAALLLAVLANPDDFTATPQEETAVTIAKKIFAVDRLLDFSQSAKQVVRQILTFAPHPGAHFFLQGERIKVYQASTFFHEVAPAGVLLCADEQGIGIACQTGAVRLHHLQRSGRRALPASEFLRGYPLEKNIGQQIVN